MNILQLLADKISAIQTIPFLYFVNLDWIGMLLLQLIQTILEIILMYILINLSLKLIDKFDASNRSGGNLDNLDSVTSKKAVILRRNAVIFSIIVIIEISSFLISISFFYQITSVLVGLIASVVLYYSFPLIIIYLFFYKKKSFDGRYILILYILGFIVPHIISMFAASAILNIAGMKNMFIFSF